MSIHGKAIYPATTSKLSNWQVSIELYDFYLSQIDERKIVYQEIFMNILRYLFDEV